MPTLPLLVTLYQMRKKFERLYCTLLMALCPVDDVKKADLAQSVFRMGVGFLAQMAFAQALAYGVRKIYFTGSFINVPFVRKIITTELQGRVDLRPKVSLPVVNPRSTISCRWTTDSQVGGVNSAVCPRKSWFIVRRLPVVPLDFLDFCFSSLFKLLSAN